MTAFALLEEDNPQRSGHLRQHIPPPPRRGLMHAPEVIVTDTAVYFDGRELPWYIAQDGISFEPGGQDDFNRMTIEFLVSTASFTDESKAWGVVSAARWFDLEARLTVHYIHVHQEITKVMKEYQL